MTCVSCKRPTDVRFSVDMDVPAFAACNATCAYTWFYVELDKRKVKP